MSDALRRSPLHDVHRAAGAKMVAFGGYLMPVSYPTGTVAEHLACRRSAACFDVSHLGSVRVDDGGAYDRLQHRLCNDLRRIGPGRAQYSQLLDDDGSVVDDVIVWWTEASCFDVMPNATNTERVRLAIGGEDTTASRAVIAVQGPAARAVLWDVWPEAAAVARFAVATLAWRGAPSVVAGTGYTGEDGVELAVPVAVAGDLWAALVAAGAVPAGLGARDTLRLEAGLPLHGHELGPGITPLQAGLRWVVGWDKEEFVGRDALVAEDRRGPRRRLRGIVGDTSRPLRDGDRVWAENRPVGTCTSGSFSPVLGRGIALALLDTGDSGEAVSDGLRVVVRRGTTELSATVVTPPFVTPQFVTPPPVPVPVVPPAGRS